MNAPKVAVEFWAQILLRHVQISFVKLQCFKTALSAHKKKKSPYDAVYLCRHLGHSKDK